jgi:hypothetical protein
MPTTITQVDATFVVNSGLNDTTYSGAAVILTRVTDTYFIGTFAGEQTIEMFRGEFDTLLLPQVLAPINNGDDWESEFQNLIQQYTDAGGGGGLPPGPGDGVADFLGWKDNVSDLNTVPPTEGRRINVGTEQYKATSGVWLPSGVTVYNEFPARPVREQPFKDIQGSFTSNGDALDADSNNSLLHIANFSNEGDYVEFNLATTPAITQSIYIGYWQGSGAVDTGSNWFAAVELRIVSGGTEYRLRNHNNTSGVSRAVPLSTPIRLVISQGSWEAVVAGSTIRTANDGLATIPTKVLSIGVAGSGDRIPLNYTFSS